LAGFCDAAENSISSDWKGVETMAHTVTLAFQFLIYVRIFLLQWMAEVATTLKKTFTPYHWLIFQLLLSGDFRMPNRTPKDKRLKVNFGLWFASHQRLMLALSWHYVIEDLSYAKLKITELADNVRTSVNQLLPTLFKNLYGEQQPSTAAEADTGQQDYFPLFVDEAQALFEWCKGSFSSKDVLSPPSDPRDSKPDADKKADHCSLCSRGVSIGIESRSFSALLEPPPLF
jgi:hypothetical protein